MSFENLLPSSATIKEKTDVDNAVGGSTPTWATLISGYKCRVYAVVGMVKITASGENVLITHNCVGEYNANIKENNIFILGSNTYRIVQIDTVYAKNYIHHLEMKLAKENFAF